MSVYNRSEREQVYIGPFGLTGEDLYDNSKITYEVQGITPYETVLEPGRNYNFTIKFKYTGNDTSDNTLTSRLNFRFMEKPELAITNEGEITGIYPGYAPQEYEFKVCNYNGEKINNVALSYGLTAEIQKPFIAKIYDSTGAEVTSSTSIDVAGKNAETGTVSKVDHTYKLKIMWDSTNPETDVAYNNAEYANKEYTAKINMVATPKPNADGDKKYANYTLTQEKDITVKTAPIHITAEPENTTIEMTNNRGEINLSVSNNDGSVYNPYETKYTISQDNTKYTLYVDEVEYSNNITEERTIGTGELITLVEKIWLVPNAGSTLDKEETANITITITSPYTNKTETKEIKITDTVPPTKPTITGGSESYLASQTISVSEVATDVGTGVQNYEYLVNNTEQAVANATGDVTTTETSQTFNTEYNGYYIWFRAVDAVGNKGEWSNSQKLNVDPNPPTVGLAVQGSETIEEGATNDIATYFTSDKNGNAPITSTVYTDTSNGNAVVENTNSLAEGTHVIRCTVTKENGLTAYAEKTIEIISAGLPDAVAVIQSKNTQYEDSLGNTFVVPGGFKVRKDLAETVDKGIVIEDSDENQFVWIPIGEVTKSDGSTVKIEFGRYSDFSLTATPTQYASNYEEIITINSYYQELSGYRESDYGAELGNKNATAKKLGTFITNAVENKGYYIARYEASFGSGDKISSVSTGIAGVTNQKPKFKQSTTASSSSDMETVTSTPGMLWNYIRQGDASLACQNLYVGNEYNNQDFVECDLINSYAWDTALMFIQKCSENTNYANQTLENSTLQNTGMTSDEVCNLYDMNGNLQEWSTEMSDYTSSTMSKSSVYRGGGFSRVKSPSSRANMRKF